MDALEYDTVVIGGGPLGLAASYYSAASGKKTVLLEKHKFFHETGSSGGNSRFFRVMYSDKKMAMLSEVSYALWKQLETASGSRLLAEQDLLFFGSTASQETVEGDFSNADNVMNDLGVPFEELAAREIMDRYPVFRSVPANYRGLIQRNSAVIQVQNSLRAFHGLASDAGAVLLDNTPAIIKGMSDCGGYIEIGTARGLIRARSLLLAPGMWTNEVIAPLGVSFDFKLWQMTVCLFEVKESSLNYPFWYEFGDPDSRGENLFYGFPIGTDKANCIKVSCDFTPDIFDSVDQCTSVPNTELIQLISEHVQKRFHGVNLEPRESKTCFYTMSSDYHMILGLLPGYNNIAILTGESGRAFKYAPLFGRILNQLIDFGESSYDISGISVSREGILAD